MMLLETSPEIRLAEAELERCGSQLREATWRVAQDIRCFGAVDKGNRARLEDLRLRWRYLDGQLQREAERVARDR
jgi:hypothetical protein